MKNLLSAIIPCLVLLFSMPYLNTYANPILETVSLAGYLYPGSDKDGDGVPNKKDDCPKVYGPLETNGCPDKDGDFIIDSKDFCPEIVGLKELNGCPDADGDLVPDSEDKCPNMWGLLMFKGCPDTDMDGLEDALDSCPFVAGDIRYNGCPDRDGDGLIDKIDKCPDEAGVASNDGCPSLENDPTGDRDKDSVQNKDDDCPYLAGPADNRGCPYSDEDNDGVMNNEDLCPKTFGPKENKGCPIIEKEVTDIIDVAYKNLEFEFSKAVIKKSSYSSLESLATILVHHPEFRLLVVGHTDNVGSEAANQILSNQRALAVKEKLIQEGIDPSRIMIKAFGESKPLTSNETEEGRQSNRRVEMAIAFD
jgi:outer membrane protein OmpA-like peptidoglycan-associated protein